MSSTPLDVSRIRERLRTRFIGRELHYHLSIDSTNTEAKRLAAAGAPAGTLVVADQQTAGKGRLGRSWIAPANSCLLFSLLFRPPLAPRQAARLTMLCTLAAAEAVRAVTGLAVGIKWPNDLVVGRTQPRKLAGVLTESAVSGDRLEFAVVGIGLNVNLDPTALGPLLAPATSLAAELGRPVDRAALLLEILQRIEARYPQLLSGQIHAEWARELVTLGQQVSVTAGQERVEGLAEAVDQDGALLVRDLAGILHPLHVGDVSCAGR